MNYFWALRRRAMAGGMILTLLAAPALAQEKNPSGDIPDSQTFVAYRSAEGIRLDVPEGWARTIHGRTVRFADKLHSVELALDPPGAGRAATNVRLAHAQATHRTYRSRGESNPVTGKRFELDNVEYTFRRGTRSARLTLSGPQGADNVDQWRRIADSFTWR